mgnify:CR=1 FL=1
MPAPQNPNAAANAIEIRGLTKTYAGAGGQAPKQALKALDLSIPAGSIFGLLGPNGAGKTNLLEAISLLTPGKGLRNATAVEMGRREPGEATGRPWAVSVELDDETRLHQLRPFRDT